MASNPFRPWTEKSSRDGEDGTPAPEPGPSSGHDHGIPGPSRGQPPTYDEASHQDSSGGYQTYSKDTKKRQSFDSADVNTNTIPLQPSPSVAEHHNVQNASGSPASNESASQSCHPPLVSSPQAETGPSWQPSGSHLYSAPPAPSPAAGISPTSSAPGSTFPPGQSNSLSIPGGFGASTPVQPPPSFSRHPAPDFPYTAFPAISLIANGKFLDDGFPLLAPPSHIQPHPFSTHDVTQDDWNRFLEDIQQTASLGAGKKIAAAVLPTTMGWGLPGLLMSKVIERGAKSNKKGPVGELVGVWNHYFFRPRRIEVVLARGSVRYSGGVTAPPSWEQEMQRLHQHGFHPTPSSPSSGHDHPSRDSTFSKDAYKAEKKKRRNEKRRMKEEYKGMSKQEKRDGQTWRLFVVPL